MTGRNTQGFALISVMIAMTVLAAIAAVYITITLSHQRDTASISRSVTGFYAAEGGLNVRASRIRARFEDYNRPGGSSPATSGGAVPCTGTNLGTQDFACDTTLQLGGRKVVTYVTDETGAVPVNGVVNPGERYAGLNYQQYAYRVISEASLAGQTGPEAKLQLEFQSRLVPMFQFAAFYNKDLEINPGPAMTLNGRVHTNENLYLSPGATLDIGGQVTAAKIFRGRKNSNECATGGSVRVGMSGTTWQTLKACSGNMTSEVLAADVAPFNGRVSLGVPRAEVPPASSLDPSAANELFAKADLRVVAKLTGTDWKLQVVNADKTVNVAATTRLQGSCTTAVKMNPPKSTATGTFFDKRENKTRTLIDVDQKQLMNCIHQAPTGTFTNADGNPLKLDDTTGNGLTLHFSFDDNNPLTNDSAAGTNTPYGVRVAQADKLGSTISGAPNLKGLTIVTNQAAYIQGDFNKDVGTQWRPASILADSINVLSNAWSDAAPHTLSAAPPAASHTEINAAFMAGTDLTEPGKYNGGLENYPRFHESWNTKELRYRGSFVSLGTSAHAKGAWKGPCATAGCYYEAPVRNWDYDSRFNDARNLPPLAPRFVYLRQLLFARDY